MADIRFSAEGIRKLRAGNRRESQHDLCHAHDHHGGEPDKNADKKIISALDRYRRSKMVYYGIIGLEVIDRCRIRKLIIKKSRSLRKK